MAIQEEQHEEHDEPLEMDEEDVRERGLSLVFRHFCLCPWVFPFVPGVSLCPWCFPACLTVHPSCGLLPPFSHASSTLSLSLSLSFSHVH